MLLKGDFFQWFSTTVWPALLLLLSTTVLCKIKLKLVVQTGCLHSLLRFTFPPLLLLPLLLHHTCIMFSCFLISNCPFLSKLPRCKPQLPLTSNCCLLKYGITKYMLLFSKYRLDWMYFHIKLYHLNFHAKSRQKKYMMLSDTFQAFLLAFLLWNDSQCVRLCDVQQPKKRTQQICEERRAS